MLLPMGVGVVSTLAFLYLDRVICCTACNLKTNQEWKFMSCSHCQELRQQTRWLLIGCTRVNNQSEALDMNATHKFPSQVEDIALEFKENVDLNDYHLNLLIVDSCFFFITISHFGKFVQIQTLMFS